ncbi:MAG: DUF2911 domain-containing protein [Ferruginibacter sp.]
MIRFKNLLLPVLFFFVLASCNKKQKPELIRPIIDSVTAAEKNPYVSEDQSQMDMSYFPVDYPLEKMNRTDSMPPLARVIYSRPHKKGRSIFGDTPQSLCQYGKEWRLGANEATEINFFRNVSINGKNIAKGTYVIYCIPQVDKWTIVLNTNLYTWGLHMDESKDIFRTDIPAMEQSPALEDFTMVFSAAKYGANLIMAWDNVKASLPIEFSK